MIWLDFMTVEQGGEGGNAVRSTWLVIAGATCFWLASQGLVYRKVPGPIVYALVCATIVIVTRFGNVGLAFMESTRYLPGALLLLIVLNSWLGARAWLPEFSKPQHDEVGIKKSIDRSFRRKRRMFVMVCVLIIVVSVGSKLITSE